MAPRRIALAALGFLLAPSVVFGAVVEVRLAAEDGPPAAVEKRARVILEAAYVQEDVAALAESRRLESSVPGVVQVDLPTGSAWRATVESESYWSAPEVFTVDRGEAGAVQGVELHLLPTGILEGRLSVPVDGRLPEEISARFESSPGSEPEIARSRTACPVEDGVWSCTVPAGTFDIRLRARGFISHYRWEEPVRRGSRRDVGTLHLVRGASVVGWVDPPPDRSFDFGDCGVELAPNLAAESFDAEEEKRRKGLATSARINERGFFELPGIAPGSYRLTIRHPGYAPTTRAPVEVVGGAETEIRALELHPYSRLALAVEPPREPSGRPWEVRLLRESVVTGHLDEAVRAPVDDDGLWQSQGLEAGHYAVRIVDAHDLPWHSERIELVPGVDAGPVEIQLPVTRIGGRVMLGEEPLAALLYFGGRHGVPSIATRSDKEGFFHVAVPRRDEWMVEVDAPDLGVYHRDEAVPVPDTDEPWVELVVPDLRVEGEVVDAAGRAVAGAWVRATAAGQPPRAIRSGEEGRFEIRLAEGVWTFGAEDQRDGKERFSALHEVTLDEEAEPRDLRLVLDEGTRISGQVVSPSDQPVVGALVVGLVEQDAGALANTVFESTTDVSGVFELQVPAGAPAVRLTVMAPGFALRQLRVPADDEGPIVIGVEQVAGTVVIHREQAAGSDRQLLVFHDDLLVLPFLHRWARANGVRDGAAGTLVLPLMEPGLYTVCSSSRQDSSRAFSTGLPPAGGSVCVQGVLSPFGQLDLVVPSPPSATADRGVRD